MKNVFGEDDGWSEDYDQRLRENNERIRRQQKIDNRNFIKDKKRAGTYYELPLWQREKLEEE